MRLTKFMKLRRAAAALDFNLIANRIKKIEDYLTSQGLPLEPQNTAITQEGIYYIDPETGMATKVVMYISDHTMKLENVKEKEIYLTGYSDQRTIERLHPYHLVRCNVLTDAENRGWKEKYRITQRTAGSFYYRIVNGDRRSPKDPEIFQEIENQRLFICNNCLMKITSIVDGTQGVRREGFQLRYFFDTDFTRSWNSHEKLSREKGFLAGIYPKDWLEICRIRKEQTHYHCESCSNDFSDPHLQPFLHVHHTDHVRRKVGYVKLECLCLACLAEHPSRAHLKETPEFIEYIKMLRYSGREAAETEGA